MTLPSKEAAERIRYEGRALSRAGMTDRFAAYSLASHPNADAVAYATDWIDQWWENGNLWLTGPVGVGKSGLAWAIVREIEESAVSDWIALPEDERLTDAPRAKALFLRWADLLADLRASFGADRRGDEPDPTAVFRRAQTVPLLVLDDLGRERPTPYALESLGTLVEERYQRLGTTIVTSNYSTRELVARLDPSSVDGERIVSRLLEGAHVYRIEGESLRRPARS